MSDVVVRRRYGRGCFRRKAFQQLRGCNGGIANAIDLLGEKMNESIADDASSLHSC